MLNIGLLLSNEQLFPLEKFLKGSIQDQTGHKTTMPHLPRLFVCQIGKIRLQKKFSKLIRIKVILYSRNSFPWITFQRHIFALKKSLQRFC